PSRCDEWSPLHEFGDDLLRHRRRFELIGIVGMRPDQHSRLEGLDRELIALEDLVADLEARALETLDAAFDGDPVAMSRWDVEFCARVDHGDADETIFLHEVLLGEAGRLEHDRG